MLFKFGFGNYLRYFNRFSSVIYGHESEQARHGLVAVFGIHLLHKKLNAHFQTGIAHVLNVGHQLDQGAAGDGMREIDALGGNRDHFQARKPGGGDEGHLIHEHERGAAKECVVVIGSVGENGFEDARFGTGNAVGKKHGLE